MREGIPQEQTQEKAKPRWKQMLLLSAFSLASLQGVSGSPQETPEAHGSGKRISTEQEEDTTLSQLAENTYVLTKEDFEHQAHSIELKSFFAPDQADISPEEKSQIIERVHQYLADVLSDRGNIDEILTSKKVIRVSCDMRQAGEEHQGRNDILAQKRGQEGEEIIKQALATFDYNTISHLSDEEIEAFKQIDFDIEIPEYEDAERGVTPYTKINNPETDEPFTQETFESLGEDEQEEVLKQSRYVTVLFALEKKMLDEVGSTKETYDRFIAEIMPDFDQTVMLFDNSTSMNDSRELFVDHVDSYSQEQEFPPNFSVGAFTKTLTEFRDIGSSQELKRFSRDLRPDERADERAVHSALKAFSNFKEESEEESRAMVVVTDERIQDLSHESLQELKERAEEYQTTVMFWLLSDDHKQVRNLTLAEVEELFVDRFESHPDYGEKLRHLKQFLADAEEQGKGIAASHFRKQIEQLRERPITIGVNPAAKETDILLSVANES